MNDIETENFNEFKQFVESNLGDIVVLDNGKFISEKIFNYWKIWCKAKSNINLQTKKEHSFYFNTIMNEINSNKLQWPTNNRKYQLLYNAAVKQNIF